MPTTLTSLTAYVSAHADVTPHSDILARWESRIVAAGLQHRGRHGAASYLAQYGKGIRPPKVIQFARLADLKGFPEMGACFWEHAYFLDTGARATLGHIGATPPPAVRLPGSGEPFGQCPQLLTAVDRETALRLARQPQVGLQEKKDGERLLLRTDGAGVTGGNKKGLVTGVPLPIADDITDLGATETDGEKIGTTYHVFDLLSHRGVDLRRLGYLDRYQRLAALVATSGGDSVSVRLVPLVTDLAAKLRLIAELESAGKEGFVLKDLHAPYVAGDGDSQHKFQFRRSDSFLAGAPHPGGRRSVQVWVLRSDGTRRDMGFVTIPGSAAMPRPGQIVSVQYLYVHAGPTGKLHQPVFQGVRPAGDVDDTDCQETKLKVAPVETDDVFASPGAGQI